MKNNPFKKGTLAYHFYRIDKFLNSPEMIENRKIGSGIITIFLLPIVIPLLANKDGKMLYADDDHHSTDGTIIQAKYFMKDIF